MRLLVTGGTGFLGRRVAAHFEDLGWQVLSPSHSQLDLTDSRAVADWFRVNRPQAVIHTAAVSDTGLCQQKPEWSEVLNVTACVTLARACREWGAKLILCSSDQVYSGSAVPGPHRETEPLTPVNVYGDQKRRMEQECLAILASAVCLRLSWMYARDGFEGEHGHFLSALTAALVDERAHLSWPVHDRRGLTDAEYVVKNLPKALELPGGVWNFGSANDKNTYDTVKAALEEAGLTEALGRLTPNEAAFAGQPRDITMDMTRLAGAGICFPTTAEGLRRALAEWKREEWFCA